MTMESDVENLTGSVIVEGSWPLGRGGFSDVFAGDYWSGVKRSRVAIKVLRSHVDSVNHAKLQRRLKREMRIWHGLNHTSIVPLLGVVSGMGPYLSMVCPWMPGGNLNEYLKRCGNSLPNWRRVQIIYDVANGLSHLHLLGVVHGDLTGSNVLLDFGGIARLSDFGLSKVIVSLKDTSLYTSLCGGAVRWAAPELYRFPDAGGEPLTPSKETDVYSFGSIIFQTLSGNVPYHYLKADAQVLLEVHNGILPLRPPLLRNEQWALIQQCWAKPTLRPTVEELIDKLVVLQDVSKDVPVNHVWMEPESCTVNIPSPNSPFRSCDLPDASPDIAHNSLPFDESAYPKAFILSPAYQMARVARQNKIMGSSSSQTLTASSTSKISFCDSSSAYRTAPLQGQMAGDQIEDYARSLYGFIVARAMDSLNHYGGAIVSMHCPSANWVVPGIHGTYSVANPMKLGPVVNVHYSHVDNLEDTTCIYIPSADPYAFTTPQAFWRNYFTSGHVQGRAPQVAPIPLSTIFDQYNNTNYTIAHGDVRCGGFSGYGYGGLVNRGDGHVRGGYALSGT